MMILKGVWWWNMEYGYDGEGYDSTYGHVFDPIEVNTEV